MKMSEEMAVRLHRMMWSDMQRELGDKPSMCDRIDFKKNWLNKNFPGELVEHNCFLCEYVRDKLDVPHGSGTIGIGSKHCKLCPIKWPNDRCGDGCIFSQAPVNYAESSISEILELPARNPSLDFVEVDQGYHKFRERLLGEYSGLPASADIGDHVAKIKEKAVDEYFESKPAAKLATMDVDAAFKQYADEQKAPIFRALAEASGLSAGNESVKAHISKIRDEAKKNGRLERTEEFFKALSVHSGVKKDDWRLFDHVEAIKAPIFQALANESGLPEGNRNVNDHLRQIVQKCYEAGEADITRELANESGLDVTASISAHINSIHLDGFEAGIDSEKERILNKIEELFKG